MKRWHTLFDVFLWITAAGVLLALIITGILTNTTLRSVEKNLPNTLFEQLRDLRLIVEDLADVVSAAELARDVSSAENLLRLRMKVATAHDSVVRMRNTYVFDNLIQASSFHAVVAPAIADIQIWLSEGVSGYGPETGTTIDIVLGRIAEAYQKTRKLNSVSEATANRILSEQRNRLDSFLFSVNLLFAVALAVTFIMILLIIRQHVLKGREAEAMAERRRVEKALMESEQRFRQLYERHKSVMLLIEPDSGAIVDANPAAAAFYGYSVDELREMNISDLNQLPPEDVFAQRQLAVLEKQDYFVFPHRLRNGEIRTVEVRSSPIEVKGQLLLFSFVHDISERKQAEEALRESQERFRELADLLPETIFEMDTSGKLTFVNRNAFDHFGFSEEDLKRGLNAFEFISPEDRPRLLQNAEKVMSGQRLGLNEYRAVRKDGSTFPIITHTTAIMHDGKPVGFRGIVIDVTETKNLEARLLQAHKMEAIGTLAGGIAHDFNNILQAIQGYAELLLFDKTENDAGYKDLHQICQAARRGAELTRQLLTFSRKVEARLRPIDLNRTVDDVRILLERTIPKMIEIKLDLMGGLHRVNADSSQIEQILMNLALNARDAMPQGGKLIIKTENILFDEDCHRLDPEVNPGEYVLLAVTDTGQGIDEKSLGLIFDPFFTTKEVGKGTGLGLPMVYGIVKNHNGHIICRSKPGEGTTFEIFFPAILQIEESPDVAVSEMEVYSGTETILLVDDEDSVPNLGNQVLKMYGYTVLGAPDAESALRIFQKEKDGIDLVILDLIMPGIGGAQCLRKLLEINPRAKVIIASGHSAQEQREGLMIIGARAYIAKPYRFQELLKVVRDVLDDEPSGETGLNGAQMS